MSAVQARLLNGDEETLVNCHTINDVRVQAATPRDIFAPDVAVLSIDQAILLTDDDALPPKVSVVINVEPYDEDRWHDALVAHAKAQDGRGVARAMAKLEDDGYGGGEAFCGGVICTLAGPGSTDAACVSLLIASRGDVNFTDEEDSTALIYAAWYGHAEIAQLLVTAGADVDGIDCDGKPALIHAAQNGNTDIAQMLITAQADVNCIDGNHSTALIYAVLSGNTDIAQMIITAQADVNHEDWYHATAFICAVRQNNEAIVQMLITAQADVRCADADRSSSLMHAVRRGMAENEQMMIADVDHAA